RAELVGANRGADNHTGVEARPADGGRDDVVVPERLADVIAAHEAGDRTTGEGTARGGLEHIRTATGDARQQDSSSVAVVAQLVPRSLQLELDARLQVGVEDRGHRPLVLTDLAHDLVGEDDGEVADVEALVLLSDDLPDPLLVGGVGEGPQE